MSDLKLLKAIWQIRFPPAASLFDNRGKIASRWQDPRGELSEWRISHNQLDVHDRRNRVLLRVDLRAVSVVMEFPDSYQAFAERAAEFSTYILDTLEVTTVDRIGLRLIRVAERDNAAKIVNQFQTKVYRLTDEDWKILGGRPRDVGLHLVMDYEDSLLNIALGPMKAAQLANHFESNGAEEQLPDVCLFADADLYKLEPRLRTNSRAKLIRRYLNEDGPRVMGMIDEFADRFEGLDVNNR